MSRPLDLAQRPFVNRRPVVRLSLVLWLAGGLLLAGNVYLYWDFLAGRGNVHAELRRVEEDIAIEERRTAALSEELAAVDLEAQNAQVAYLNQRIEQRRFSWSRLFDQLAALLPEDVRIQSLTPRAGEAGRRRGAGAELLAQGKVLLEIQAAARSDEAILEVVDALFADPDFERPNLIQQSRDDGGLVRFNVEVIYHSPTPPGPAAPAEVLPAEGTSPASPAAPARLGRPASAPPEIS